MLLASVLVAAQLPPVLVHPRPFLLLQHLPPPPPLLPLPPPRALFRLSPQVECPSGGYFRHPLDCTRFYRCVDTSGGLGRYKVFKEHTRSYCCRGYYFSTECPRNTIVYSMFQVPWCPSYKPTATESREGQNLPCLCRLEIGTCWVLCYPTHPPSLPFLS